MLVSIRMIFKIKSLDMTFKVIKKYTKPLCTNIKKAEITLMNDKMPA